MEKTQSFLERICNVADEGFLCVDGSGRIVLANGYVERLFGYTLDEMRHQPVEMLLPERLREKHVGLREQYMSRPAVRGMGKCMMLAGRRNDGTVVPVTIGLSPFPTQEGIHVLCHIRDITEDLRLREEKRVAESRFQRLCDANIIGVAEFEFESGPRFINRYLANLLGYESTDPKDYPNTLRDIIAPEYRMDVKRRIMRTRAGSQIVPWRIEILNKSGERIPVLVGMARELLDSNLVLGYVLDMRESHAAEEALKISERRQSEQTRRLQAILDALPANLAVLDGEGRIVSVNRAWREFADDNAFMPGGNYGIGENYLKSFRTAAESKRGAENLEMLQARDGMKALQMGEINQFSQDYSCHSQIQKRWYTMLAARLGSDPAEGMVVMHVNITDKKLVEEELQYNALFDSLTALPNRAFFMSRLEHAIQRAVRNERFHYALLFLDLDRFKNVNDGLGHHAGDLLLREVATRLRTAVRAVDTVARLGGDEFVVLLEDLADETVAQVVAERIQKEITRAYDLGGTLVHIGASIGIAHSSSEQNSASILLRNADAAMYAAKEQGRGRIAKFDERLHEQAMRRLQIEGDLARGLEQSQFSLVFQPIIEIGTGRLRAFEALIRWHHPERGLISPLDFIPVAEDTGLILSLGHWIVRESCRQRRDWARRNPALQSVGMNINLSPKQFLDPGLPGVILGACKAHGCDPSDIGLEITEGVVMENFGAATNVLGQLRAVNCRILLDDFGTGYSSLAYIHKFPVDGLKIDRSFVMRMHEDEGTRKIIRTIIGLARDLDLHVTAEGVEREEHLVALKKLGCDFAQGY